MKLFSQDGLPFAAAPRSTRWALLIGINQYPFLGEVNLDGSVNDAMGYQAVLRDRFDFPEENITLLLDEAATHDGILNAFDRLVAVVQDGDQVVLSYSGHGRRIANPDSLEADQMDETFVPADSGSGFYPNRDIRDDEFLSRIVALTERGAYVTFFCDCCHSSASLRDDFRASTRGVAADFRRRSNEQQLIQIPEGLGLAATQEANPRPVEPSKRSPAPRPKVGLGLRRDHYVYVAACRDSELATEHIEQTDGGRQVHGALSYYLQRELASCLPGEAMRAVIGRAFAALSSECPEQHPRAEGALEDTPLFVAELDGASTRLLPSTSEQRASVRERTGKSVVLSVGRLHGETLGSRYAVYAASSAPLSSTPWASQPRPVLGVVEVTAVRATSASAKILLEASPGAITEGSLAIEYEHSTTLPPLRVELCCDPDHTQQAELTEALARLHDRLTSIPVVEVVSDGSASLRLYALSARAQPSAPEGADVAIPSTPVPQLGALSEPVWALVGRDGQLRTPAVPLRDTGSLQSVEDRLRGLATQQLILHLVPRPSVLRDRLQVALLVRCPGQADWQSATRSEGTPLVVDEGDALALRLSLRTMQTDPLAVPPAPLHVGVLHLSASGETQVWASEPENPAQLRQDAAFELGLRPGEQRILHIAEGYPPTGWDRLGDLHNERSQALDSWVEPVPAAAYVQDLITVFVGTRPLQDSLQGALRVQPSTSARAAVLRSDVAACARSLALALRGRRSRRRPASLRLDTETPREDWAQLSVPILVRRRLGS
ncbi:MAG: caspase family protein [Myxococcales bacterium]|nr:caspase family protein [Myxococcales bacterium]